VWQGQVNGWLLVMLVINIILSAFNLRVSILGSEQRSEEEQAGRGLDRSSGFKIFFIKAAPIISVFFTLGTVALLLTHVHSLPAHPLTQAVTELNKGVRPNDAVITNDPEIAMPFAELYKGRAPVLGLQSGGFPLSDPVTRRLRETIAAHSQIWWLPNGVPPEESAVEQTLLAAGFRARNDNFDGQRLVLFAYPPDLTSDMVTVDATFEHQIRLVEAAYPSQVSAGTALPIEVRWQTQALLSQDYHVFVHLVTKEGEIVTQADGQPAQWTRPTTTWAVGETVVDRHGLWLPSQTVAGDYELRVGLYRPEDGQRLHLTSGGEFVELPVTIR
jgi:hypothetical protein